MKFGIEAFFALNCPSCGAPLDRRGLCSACLESLFPERRGGAVFFGRYARLQRLVKAVKYRQHWAALEVVAERLSARVRATDWPLTAVTFVPSFFWRAWTRGGYTPSLLASLIGHALGLPVKRALRRVRYTPSQTRRTFRKALPQIFAARPSGPEVWLLVDDVYTSGTTFRRAAEALLDAGAKEVYGLFIAVADPARLDVLPYRRDRHPREGR